MSPSELRLLRQLARLEGILLSYVDAAGETRQVSAEALQGTLQALGTADGLDSVQDALRAAQSRRCQQGCEPVMVAWHEREPQLVPVFLPGSSRLHRAEIRLQLESGEQQQLRFAEASSSRARVQEVNGSRYTVRRIALPRLPQGYHQLEVETGAGLFKSLLIAAPMHAYAKPQTVRRWGVFLPVYAGQSRSSWGAGNLGDWQKLGSWMGRLGGSVLATLPLLASFLDRPTCAPSPYSPASRLFWNDFYIDIGNLPELTTCREARRLVQSTEFQRVLARFRARRTVDYGRQAALRRQVLEVLAREFYSAESLRRREFQCFVQDRPELDQYACFRAACDQANCGWPAWPEEPRLGTLRSPDYREIDKQYHLYVQWLAEEQVRAAARQCHSAGVSFYLDLPLGVHPDGYDVWREQHQFALRASAGAPPDSFFSKGQDWGFPPLLPRRVREDHYRYVIEYLRFQMKYAGLLRIDHVMGLHRLYWVPRGLPPTHGAYVSYPTEELYAILCLESHRHQTTLVGENLGTVPPAVNAAMRRHSFGQMYVLQYEQRPDRREPLRLPPAHSVASLNTHDMPSFYAHWKGQDITDRSALGLLHRGEVQDERRRRKRLNAALVAFLRREGWLRTKRAHAVDVLRACLQWLSASPAEVVLVNLEDLWFEPLPQNVPGTFMERPNWQRKSVLRLEQIERAPAVREVLREVSRLRNSKAPRAHPKPSWQPRT